MPFNPDQFLQETTPPPQGRAPAQVPRGFNPDQFLLETQQPQAPAAPVIDPLAEARERPEAELGFSRRAQFALEPIESNRRAFLVQEFGQENVFEDKEGNLFLRESGGEVRPLNKPGFSTADIAEFAGTIPEIAGAGAGAIAGLGAASLPAAAIGGGAGSLIRQGLAAGFTDVPQVATPEERIKETALATGLGLVGGAAAKVAGKLLKPIIPKISKAGKKLADIVREEGLPDLTFAQKAGKGIAEGEKALAKVPGFGKFVAKKISKQQDAAKKNLQRVAGDFLELDSPRGDAGFQVRELADKTIKGVKKEAGELFEKVATKGDKVLFSKEEMKLTFLESVEDLGLFDEAGKRLTYNPRTGIPRKSWNIVQDVLGDVVEDLDKGDVSAKVLDTLRKTVDGSINFDNIKVEDKILLDVSEALKGITEDALDQVSPGLAKDFKQARALWRSQLGMKESVKKLRNVGDEQVINKVFTNTKTLRDFKKIVDKDTVEKMGKQFAFDLLKGKTARGETIKATAALKNFNSKAEVLKEALSPKDFRTLKNNLEFLAETGENIDPNKVGFFQLATNPLSAGIRGLLSQTARQAARTQIGVRKKIPEIAGAAAITAGQKRKRKQVFEGRKTQKKSRAIAKERKK